MIEQEDFQRLVDEVEKLDTQISKQIVIFERRIKKIEDWIEDKKNGWE